MQYANLPYKVSLYHKLENFFRENHARNNIAYSMDDAKVWAKMLARGLKVTTRYGLYEKKIIRGLWLGGHLLTSEGHLPMHFRHSQRVRSLFDRATYLVS